jgi:hypothetical protein
MPLQSTKKWKVDNLEKYKILEDLKILALQI